MSDEIQQQQTVEQPLEQQAAEIFSGEQAAEQQAATEQTPPQQGTTLTKEQLQEVMTTAVRAAQPVQQQAAPQLSQAELNRMLNVFEAKAEHMQRLGLAPENLPALQEILQAVVRQAVTMATYQQQALKGELQQQMTPLQEYTRQQQEAQYRVEFAAKYPEFKGYEPMLEMCYQALVNEGKKFDTKEKAFEAVAERARQVKSSLPGLSGQASGQQQQTTRTPGKQMSTVSGSGHGGGNGAGAGGNKSTAQWLFGQK